MDEFLDSESSYQRLLSDYKKYGSLTVGVDFDGTLYDYHKNGSSHKQVIELVKELYRQGFQIIIWTANGDHSFVAKHLESINIKYHGINTDGLGLGWYSRKPFFTCLLDDRSGLLQVYNELTRLLKDIKKMKEEKWISELYKEGKGFTGE